MMLSIRAIASTAILFLFTFSASAFGDLAKQFANPPHEAKPLTWFHVMSGNMSKVGLTKDLEALAAAGVGGTILFNVTLGTHHGKVRFNSPSHIEHVGHMAKESQRLGLSFGIHNCDGWTASGGPWITPEHSMKKVTWSETIVNGGKVNLKLPQPSTVLDYYKDIAVVAYPALPTEISDASNQPQISASNASFKTAAVVDDDENTGSSVRAEGDQKAWVQFEFDEPFDLRLINILSKGSRRLKVKLEVSDDGENFRVHSKLPLRRPGKSLYGFDQTFDGVKSRFFRLVASQNFKILEVKLSSTASAQNYYGRTSFARTKFDDFKTIGKAPKGHVIPSRKIRNLTANMNQQGELNVTLPKGKWTIMRFGYTTTGAINSPASEEGTGLEVDKFSREALDVHYGAYVTNVLNKVKAVAPGAIQSIEVDSYEVGGQTWTQQYDKLFKEKFGYDLLTYLPLFAGKFIDSPDTSEAVLWDIRDLSNTLMVENYYGYFTELAHADGVKTYVEPYGFGPFNDLDAGSKADIPMGEFWLGRPKLRMASARSAAHIYGKNLVSAEAFTAGENINWSVHPGYAKLYGDRSWGVGVNQLVFHRFAHQANTHVLPGMMMYKYGANFDRTQTWWQGAGHAWFKYLARGQHMLQQGHPVADVLYFLGDAVPTTCPEKLELKDLLPYNYNYDCLNSDVLNSGLTGIDGRARLSNGASYKAIYLSNHETLSLASLESIHRLAQNGVIIVGEPSKKIASFNPNKKDVKRFNQLVKSIWSKKTTYVKPAWNEIFKENNINPDIVTKNKEGIYYAHRKFNDTDIYFIHNGPEKEQLFDITFNVAGKIPELWNPLDGKIKKLAAFESTDTGGTRVPLWLDPNESAFIVFKDSSKGINKQPVATVLNNKHIDLELDENGQIIASAGTETTVNLRHKNSQSELIKFANIPKPINISSPWTVDFNKYYGLDKSLIFDDLIDWKDHPLKDVRSYSGTATYKNTLVIPDGYIAKDQNIYIDLGDVSIAATVKVNGKNIATLWVSPFKVNISHAVKPGVNDISIEVANLWVNRLITDESFENKSGYIYDGKSKNKHIMPAWYTDNKPQPKSKRFSFSTHKILNEDDPLVSSGLLGPVKAYVVKRKVL